VYPGFQPGDAISAVRNISSLYADLEYRKDKWMLSSAARYEYYDELTKDRSNLAGKLGIRYDWNANLAIRGTISTGFRAPSLHQRYFQNTSTQFVGGLPSQALTVNNKNSIVKNAFGIDDLKPEIARNASVGLVGALGRHITYSLDAYVISIRDRIVLSSQFNRSNPLIQTILTNNGVDPSVNALQFWTNAVNTRTQGIDVVVTDKFNWAGGRVTLSIAGSFNNNKVVGGIKTNSVIDDPVNNPGLTDASKNPANDLSNALFDRQQRSRLELAQPRSKINLQLGYEIGKWSVMLRSVRFGSIVLLNNVDPNAINVSTGVYWNDAAPETDQTFSAKWTTDLVLTYRFNKTISVSAGAANLFDVYPDRIFIDSRNDPNNYYNAPVSTSLGTLKTQGGYNASRDLSNRGRLLFPANQFGSNGRFLFARLNVDLFKVKS
jgi:iron complex outermembrane receptor protein